MKTTFPSLEDEALLVRALHGDERAWTKLEAHFRAPLLKLARRWCPEFSDDLREEISQEVWAEISRRRADFAGTYQPASQSAIRFIASFVPNAAQKVRSVYRGPGTRSRRRRTVSSCATPRVPDSGWKAPPPSSYDEIQSTAADPYWEHDMDTHDARIAIARVAASAPPAIRAAIFLVVNHGATLADAASSAGLSTPTFIRRLSALGRMWPLAA
jgi:DNA-directed RNA polymerase specialized sigma24 family protein